MSPLSSAKHLLVSRVHCLQTASLVSYTPRKIYMMAVRLLTSGLITVLEVISNNQYSISYEMICFAPRGRRQRNALRSFPGRWPRALWGLTEEGEAQVSVPALRPVAPETQRPGPGLRQAAPPDGREAAWGGGGGAGRWEEQAESPDGAERELQERGGESRW